MKRFVLQTDAEIIRSIFEIADIDESVLSLSYNHAQGDKVTIIVHQDKQRVVQVRPWIRPFQHTTAPFLHTEELNGMISGVRTCIIPASGFYVWKEQSEDAFPFYIRRHDHPVLAIAGFLMSGDDGTDGVVPLITGANPLIRPVQASMPVLLTESMIASWLNGDVSRTLERNRTDLSLLEDLTVYRVPDLVNDLSAEGPELIQPIPKLDNED